MSSMDYHINSHSIFTFAAVCFFSLVFGIYAVYATQSRPDHNQSMLSMDLRFRR